MQFNHFYTCSSVTVITQKLILTQNPNIIIFCCTVQSESSFLFQSIDKQVLQRVVSEERLRVAYFQPGAGDGAISYALHQQYLGPQWLPFHVQPRVTTNTQIAYVLLFSLFLVDTSETILCYIHLHLPQYQHLGQSNRYILL